ncbi:cytochrome oxidase Cu insertion factor (SCO1/SenC/PrrC family) [Methylorubrum rhodesianum]|jgi:hypothetical protein|nr:cytochrome oxidase Cu insertion factor (SCO1/SenC/PrrC family) [Methylorubrum rhodesianum]
MSHTATAFLMDAEGRFRSAISPDEPRQAATMAPSATWSG